MTTIAILFEINMLGVKHQPNWMTTVELTTKTWRNLLEMRETASPVQSVQRRASALPGICLHSVMPSALHVSAWRT